MAAVLNAPLTDAPAIPTVNIVINDVELAVPKGELIVESCKRLGIEIPIFCYHPRMKPVGMCRMCLVEVATKAPDGTVRKMPKPQACCTLPASEGLMIWTDTEAITKDRKGVLEFLLINHPLDCPICDRGGECPLQNNALFYGPSTSRYVEAKRHAPKAYPLSEYVALDLERCIQCGRCVRFTEEISGDSQLALRFRGNQTQPGTFELTNFESKFSGNTIEICPVGALTDRKYRFRARPWDLQTNESICTVCSNGCAIWFDSRAGKFSRVRARTNEDVNEEWTCDRGRFGHGFYNSEGRAERVLLRDGDALRPSEWTAAYARILERFVEGGDAVGFLAGTGLSNESLHLLSRFASEFALSPNLDYRFETILHEDRTAHVDVPVTELEKAKTIVVFGTSLSDEEPIVYLRVRKAWFLNGAKVIVAHDGPTDVDSFADTLLRYAPGTGEILAKALAGEIPPYQASEATGIPLDRLLTIKPLLADSVVLTTTGADGLRSIRALAQGAGARLNVYPRGANEHGAGIILGQPPRDTHAILQGCVDGSIRSLWLSGVDLFALHPDRALVTRALESVEFLVVQDFLMTETSEYASVVLPMTAPAEGDGTFVNMDGLVQEVPRILAPRGEAKPAWRVTTELMSRIRPGMPFIQARDVFADLEKSPAWAN